MKVVTIRTRQPNGQVVKKTTTPANLPKKMTTFHYEGKKNGSWSAHVYMRTLRYSPCVVRYPLHPQQERQRMKQMPLFIGLTEDDMLDLLDAFGYDTESFQDCPNLVREFACNIGYVQEGDGFFYKTRV